MCVLAYVRVCVYLCTCVCVAAQVAYAIGYGYYPPMLSSYPGSGLNVSFLLIAHNNFTGSNNILYYKVNVDHSGVNLKFHSWVLHKTEAITFCQ